MIASPVKNVTGTLTTKYKDLITVSTKGYLIFVRPERLFFKETCVNRKNYINPSNPYTQGMQYFFFAYFGFNVVSSMIQAANEIHGFVNDIVRCYKFRQLQKLKVSNLNFKQIASKYWNFNENQKSDANKFNYRLTEGEINEYSYIFRMIADKNNKSLRQVKNNLLAINLIKINRLISQLEEDNKQHNLDLLRAFYEENILKKQNKKHALIGFAHKLVLKLKKNSASPIILNKKLEELNSTDCHREKVKLLFDFYYPHHNEEINPYFTTFSFLANFGRNMFIPFVQTGLYSITSFIDSMFISKVILLVAKPFGLMGDAIDTSLSLYKIHETNKSALNNQKELAYIKTFLSDIEKKGINSDSLVEKCKNLKSSKIKDIHINFYINKVKVNSNKYENNKEDLISDCKYLHKLISERQDKIKKNLKKAYKNNLKNRKRILDRSVRSALRFGSIVGAVMLFIPGGQFGGLLTMATIASVEVFFRFMVRPVLKEQLISPVDTVISIGIALGMVASVYTLPFNFHAGLPLLITFTALSCLYHMILKADSPGYKFITETFNFIENTVIEKYNNPCNDDCFFSAIRFVFSLPYKLTSKINDEVTNFLKLLNPTTKKKARDKIKDKYTGLFSSDNTYEQTYKRVPSSDSLAFK